MCRHLLFGRRVPHYADGNTGKTAHLFFSPLARETGLAVPLPGARGNVFHPFSAFCFGAFFFFIAPGNQPFTIIMPGFAAVSGCAFVTRDPSFLCYHSDGAASCPCDRHCTRGAVVPCPALSTVIALGRRALRIQMQPDRMAACSVSLVLHLPMRVTGVFSDQALGGDILTTMRPEPDGALLLHGTHSFP